VKLLCHPREQGELQSKREHPGVSGDPAFWYSIQLWIPAFAGMTVASG